MGAPPSRHTRWQKHHPLELEKRERWDLLLKLDRLRNMGVHVPQIAYDALTEWLRTFVKVKMALLAACETLPAF